MVMSIGVKKKKGIGGTLAMLNAMLLKGGIDRGIRQGAINKGYQMKELLLRLYKMNGLQLLKKAEGTIKWNHH